MIARRDFLIGLATAIGGAIVAPEALIAEAKRIAAAPAEWSFTLDNPFLLNYVSFYNRGTAKQARLLIENFGAIVLPLERPDQNTFLLPTPIYLAKDSTFKLVGDSNLTGVFNGTRATPKHGNPGEFQFDCYAYTVRL